jgi:hypothetical protein
MATNKRVANRQHRWLSSVEITGVVLSEPVLADAGNFRSLDKAEVAAFRKQREIWNLPKGMVEGNGQPAWINFILEDFLGLKDKEYWQVGASIPADKVVNLHEQQETLRPNRILLDEGRAVMLVLEVPREQSLDKPWIQDKGRWKASPTTKIERLLRETVVELGLLTNGEAWRLVVASPSETTSWMTWTAQTWNDDPLTLAAFKDLLGESRFFAGPRDQVILELIKQSRQRQLDVADQLGNQVREALQILVHELDRVDAEVRGQYLVGYSEAEVFESSVAFIMRLLFTLYAEENGLLPHGNVTYDRAYGVLHLLTELEETRRLAPEKLKHSYAAYARLLASARLLHDGSIDPDIRIAAHGGQLFDPNRYPLLEGRAKNGEWPTEAHEPPKVSDAAIRDILRSLKYARAEGVRQLVSYRTLAVEQIGHMYEGLLDRRVARAPANQTLLLLQGGPKIAEPEPVSASEFAGLSEAALIKAIASHTSKAAGSIKKTLERDEDRHSQLHLGTDDAELLAQAKPVERFLQSLGVVRPGGLYVTYGQDRRSSGAHYTPPTLTEPVVRRTLEHQVYVNVDGKPGLLVEPKLIKTPQEILALKVCDPAMGSGAFLVQATRYLAERLVDAWERMTAEQPGAILTMPFATPSQGKASESLMPESREERIVFARRYVAERCIYGVDMNRLAVEMAKLSLWLTTLSTDRPFTFVDHALKHGNSLVGLSLAQIRNFTWKPITADFGPLFAQQTEEQAVKHAEQHREAIHAIADHNFIEKEKENRIAEEALATLRFKATLAVAAFFNGSNTKQREAKLIEYRYWLERQGLDEKATSELEKIIKGFTTGEKPIIPFCWEVEFPEVFHRKNGGFDALVGNPPFAGKNTTIEGNRDYFLDWLKLVHEESHGNSDLVAHFFRQAFNLLRQQGSFGLIATKTIRQGDTRSTGLRWIVNHGGVIYNAQRRVPWPGKAAVIVSLIFATKGNTYQPIYLDQKVVGQITAYLFDKGDSDDPYVLSANADKSFQGSIPLGMGFTFDDTDTKGVASSIAEMHRLIEKDPKNRERIFPYIGGAEVNDSPTHQHHRYIIDFFDMEEEEAKQWPALYEIVNKKVKPERNKQKDKGGKEFWWRFLRHRPALYNAIHGFTRTLVTVQTSKYRTFTFLPNGMVYDQKLIVFAVESMADFCVMHSRFHEEWALFFGSSLVDRPVYTPSDCFETFPFPVFSDNIEALQEAGQKYYDFRKTLLVTLGKGLTDVYNLFNNPDAQTKEIVSLRTLHAAMDKAVLSAYGWSDLSLAYDFIAEYEVDEGKNVPWKYRWPDDIRDEVLARLLALNKGRHLQERNQKS